MNAAAEDLVATPEDYGLDLSRMPTPEHYDYILDPISGKSELERSRLFRMFCRNDLFFLLRYGCQGLGYMDKQWWLDRCREVQADPNGMLDLWARGHGKSTVITFGLTLQDILTSHGNNPDPKWNGTEVTVGIFSHVRAISKAFLRKIKGEAEGNQLLQGVFPDILWDKPDKDAPKWSENDGIIFKREANPKEATVEACGLTDGMPTGKHFNIRVYDDVVTEQSVTTVEQSLKTTSAWELSGNMGVIGGISYERYIGTRYDLFDTYDTMIKRGAAKTRMHPATDDGTITGDPVFLTDAEWRSLVDHSSAYIVSCQQLLDPTPDENAYFRMDETLTAEGKPPTINWYDSSRPLKFVRNYGATDAATKNQKGDYTALGIISIDSSDNWYIRDVYHKQVTSDIWIDQELAMARHWRPQRWVGEGGQIENVAGTARRKRIRELKADGWCGGWETVPRITDKPTHAIPFQGRWNNGRVFLPRDAKTGKSPPWVAGLLMEMKNFPRPPDDQVDMLANLGRALDDLWKGSHPSSEAAAVMQMADDGEVKVNTAFIKDQVKKLGREVAGRFD